MSAGDELAATHDGNNNWYGHDNKMSRLNWSPLQQEGSMQATFHRFMSEVGDPGHGLAVLTSLLQGGAKVMGFSAPLPAGLTSAGRSVRAYTATA